MQYWGHASQNEKLRAGKKSSNMQSIKQLQNNPLCLTVL